MLDASSTPLSIEAILLVSQSMSCFHQSSSYLRNFWSKFQKTRVEKNTHLKMRFSRGWPLPPQIFLGRYHLPRVPLNLTYNDFWLGTLKNFQIFDPDPLNTQRIVQKTRDQKPRIFQCIVIVSKNCFAIFTCTYGPTKPLKNFGGRSQEKVFLTYPLFPTPLCVGGQGQKNFLARISKVFGGSCQSISAGKKGKTVF